MNKTVSGFLERNLPDFKENIVVDFEEGKQALSLQSGSHPDYGMAEPLEHSIKSLSQLKMQAVYLRVFIGSRIQLFSTGVMKTVFLCRRKYLIGAVLKRQPHYSLPLQNSTLMLWCIITHTIRQLSAGAWATSLAAGKRKQCSM